MKIIFLTSNFIGLLCFANASKISTGAASIANEVYTFRHFTTVVWWRSKNEDVKDFVVQFKGSVTLVVIEKHLNFSSAELSETISYQQTVFFASNPDEFKYFLKKINFITPIRVILVLNDSDKTNLSRYTKAAWDMDVIDVIIVSENIDNQIIISTYMPYRDSECGDYTPIPLSITTNKKYFRNKVKNFFKCPIRVSIFDIRPFVKLTITNNIVTAIGDIDGEIIKLVLEKINATMAIVAPSNNLMNGTREIAFKALVHNLVDITIPTSLITPERYSLAQISFTLEFVDVIWCMPKRREIYEWAKVALPFFNSSTLLIIAAFALVYTTIKVFKKYAPSKPKSRDNISFKLFGIFLSEPIKFETVYCLINSIYILWIWFSIIVRVFYQGDLINGFQETILEPRIKTLNEAIGAVDFAVGFPLYLQYFTNTSTIRKRYQSIASMDYKTYVEKISSGERYLLAIDEFKLKFYGHKLQVLDERILTAPKCVFMRARWGAAPEISRLVSHVFEAGFYTKFRRDVLFEQSLLYRNLTDNVDEFEALDLSTLRSCFYGLGVSYAVCFCVFVGEIYRSTPKINKRIKPKTANGLQF